MVVGIVVVVGNSCCYCDVFWYDVKMNLKTKNGAKDKKGWNGTLEVGQRKVRVGVGAQVHFSGLEYPGGMKEQKMSE